MPDVGFQGLEDAPVVPQAPRATEESRKAPGQVADTGYNLAIEDGMYQDHDGVEAFPFENHGQNLEHQEGTGITPNKRQQTKDETQRRVLKLIIDEHTMISREEMVEYRDNYQLHQAQLIRERSLKQVAMATKMCIESFSSRPLSVSNCGPDLTAFWSLAGARNISTHPLPQRVPGTRDEDVHQYDAELFPDVQQPYEIEMEPPEPEVRRRHAGAEGNDIPADMGINEGFGGLMPWSIDFHASADSRSERSSGSDRLHRDFETIFDPASGRPVKRQRKLSGTGGSTSGLSVMDNELQTRHHHHFTPTGSSSGSQSRYGSYHDGSQHGSRQGSRATSRQRGDEVGRELSMDAHDHYMTELGSASTQGHIVLDRETVNFLGYVRSILREANAKSFSFSDVMSGHRQRSVAASAFYHVLGKILHLIVFEK